jgi:hypothetical protein
MIKNYNIYGGENKDIYNVDVFFYNKWSTSYFSKSKKGMYLSHILTTI